MLNAQDISNLLGFGTTIAAIVGLVVWLVKAAFKRQGDITDRYFLHLEENQRMLRSHNDQLVDTVNLFKDFMTQSSLKSDRKIALLEKLNGEIEYVKTKIDKTRST